MTTPGGSATANGILYQILGTLNWAARLSLTAVVDEHDFTDARLVIEPADGGDLQVLGGSCRIVEQWKAKSDAGTWSVRRVVEDVLPDLYRAIDLETLAGAAEYRFVSEGRTGRWSAFNSLLHDLKSSVVPATNCIDALDNNDRQSYLPGTTHSRREFFEWIATTLRENKHIAIDTLEVTHRKLWHLLGHFVVKECLALEELIGSIESILHGIVDEIGQAPGKRRELCGLLVELAAQGDTEFSARDLLSRAGLSAVPLHDWVRNRDLMLDRVRHTSAFEWGYRAEVDVRQAPRLPKGKAVHVFSGESGQGKTWQLSAVALRVFNEGGAAVAITATGDSEVDLQKAANEIWQGALKHDNEISLESLARRRRRVVPGVAEPWLTVCIDDVLSFDEARKLLMFDWERLGIRLAVSTLPPITTALRRQFAGRLEVYEVPDFTAQELRQYLELHDHNWTTVRRDVLHTLTRPLLAHLFCEIAEKGRWTPANEYELFERCWLRIREARCQTDYPHDLEYMRRLAATVLDPALPYPWPIGKLLESGVSAEMLRRLESIGWLRRLPHEKVEITHDRLLNWAVAEGLVARREVGSSSAEEIGEVLASLLSSGGNHSSRYLGYVPMDALWLLADPARDLLKDIPVVLECMERPQATGRVEIKAIYEDLLPTLGERILASIVARVTATADCEHNPFPTYLSNAICKITERSPDIGARWAHNLLLESIPPLQEAGVRALAKRPTSDALDSLWTAHLGNVDRYKARAGEGYWLPYQRTFAALQACLPYKPSWLVDKIESIDTTTEPVWELAYLVATLEGPVGSAIWQQAKQRLISKVPSDRVRCLARCIEQHRDLDEADRLESWLGHDMDFASSAAFSALVRIAPERAIRRLPQISRRALYLSRGAWLRPLILRFPNETRDVLRRLIVSASRPEWEFASLYQDACDLMDETTVDVLLDAFAKIVERTFANREESRRALGRPMELLSSISRLSLVARFEQRAGKPIEMALCRIASEWIQDMTLDHDWDLHNAAAILLKINGEGLTHLANLCLEARNKYSNLFGIKLAAGRPDSQTRSLLAQLAISEDLWNAGGYPLVQDDAAIVLASLGENRGVVEGTLKTGLVSNKLAEIRREQPPMGDDVLRPVIAALDSDSEAEQERGMAVLAISGRNDLSQKVVDILRAKPADCTLARLAAHTLSVFEYRGAETPALLAQQLAIPSHIHAAMAALLRNGSPEALSALEASLYQTGITPGNAVESALAINLYRHPLTRDAAARVIWRALQDKGVDLLSPELLLCLPDEVTPEMREYLLQLSYAPDSDLRTVGCRATAIRAIARFDCDAAFAAARAAIESLHADRELVPALLMELDEEEAIPLLCRAAQAIPPTEVKWAIGRSLRRSKSQAQVRRALLQMVDAEDQMIRQVGTELCGWSEPGRFDNELGSMMTSDPAFSVREAATIALERIASERDVLELLPALQSAGESRKWSIIQSILKIGDPYLLDSPKDSLWIGHYLPFNHRYLWQRIWRELERSYSDRKRQAEKTDRGW